MAGASGRALAVQSVVQATANESEEVKQAALAAVTQPDQATTNDLWRYLVVGLLLLVLVALSGVIYLLADGDKNSTPELALTAFTALLTGLLGLFVKSPTQDEGG